MSVRPKAFNPDRRIRELPRERDMGACPARPLPVKRGVIRKDPVKFRVAIPAADPPDNRQHGFSLPLANRRAALPCA